jgi:hypothetical protein
MRRKAQRDEVAAVLRDRLQAADRDIAVPEDLWERVRTPSVVVRPEPPRVRSRPLLASVGLALGVAAVAAGTWWAVGAGRSAPTADPARSAAAGRPTVRLTVYNAEAACRPLRTMECALRLAQDPYAPYAAADNTAGKVWHGDRVAATCVVTDGRMVQDESGVTSTRWYLVSTGAGTGDSTAGGVAGWLPGVRTRNTVDIPTCTAAQAALR